MGKFIQDFTLHTHTVGFDGHNTVQEMAEKASSMGFSTIGISNHFIVHPEIKRSRFYSSALQRGYDAIYSESFDQAMERFQPHYEEIEKIQKISRIRILRGMEVDFFEDEKWFASFERAIKILKPDYIIGSSHFVYYDGYLCNVHDINNADACTGDGMLQMYWDKVRTAAESGLFTWMAHLDLPKKLGLGREDKWRDAESRAVKAIADTKTGIEINTGLYAPDIYEPYPSERILKQVAEHDIPVLISDDSHKIEQIGRHFDEAAEFAQKCGVDNFMNLQKILDFSKETI